MEVKYPKPKACGASNDRIANFAETIASGLNFKPGDDLEGLVACLRGKIDYLPLNEDLSKVASITVEKGGSFTIRLSALLFPLQKRFSIAHELGHLFLHSNYGEHRLKAYHEPGKENSRVEREADEFAYALLMPPNLFKSTVNALGKDSTKVAAYFMVPEPLARQRMGNAEW